MKATCRHWLALSEWLLSYDVPSMSKPWSGTSFHSLHATSQALQPMQMLVSVKNPLRFGGSSYPVSRAGSTGPKRLFLPIMCLPHSGPGSGCPRRPCAPPLRW